MGRRFARFRRRQNRTMPTKRTVLLVFVPFVLVAALATRQIVWMSEVEVSTTEASRALVTESLRGALREFRDEVELLLWTFGADADRDPSGRLQGYWSRYLRWSSRSDHQPALKRILFLDLAVAPSTGLSELLGQPLRLEKAAWSPDLDPVREHIREFGFSFGHPIGERWNVTWFYFPRAAALLRPITRPGGKPRNGIPRGWVAGYLILQLAPDYVREELIPGILTRHFAPDHRGARIEFRFGPERTPRFVYVSRPGTTAAPDGSLAAVGAFSLVPPRGQPLGDWTAHSDLHVPLSILGESAPTGVADRGAQQRITLGRKREVERTARVVPTRSPPSPDTASGDVPRAFAEAIGQLPRLFLADREPYQFDLVATDLGVGGAEVMQRDYKQTVAIWGGASVLLFLAMALVAIIQNRTARRVTAQAEAAAAQSHQLRNPLAGIALVGDAMAKGAPASDDKLSRYGHLIREAAERLVRATNRRLRMACLEAGKGSACLTAVDVSEVAKKAFEAARPAIADARFASECSLASGLPLVMADAAALRQSLDELLDNAVRFGLPGRWVRIETAEAGRGRAREVQIRVSDRGHGIMARDAKEVFEPYYRASEGSEPVASGIGLGLALAAGTVKTMGGRLSLQTDVGRGSVFTIHLPVPS